MIPNRSADLAEILGRLGASVSVGAKTASAQVSAADQRAEGEEPVRLIAGGVLLIARAGDLDPVAPGDDITVNEGPLAGTYVVDRVLRSADGAQVEILAR